MLHIGYLVQQFPPEVGAGPARVMELAARWLSSGAKVTVITAMPNRPGGRIYPEYRGKLVGEEDWSGVRVLRSWLYAVPEGGFLPTIANNTSFMVTAGLHGLVRRLDLDVLIASSPPFFPHLSGALVSRAKRVPLVLEIRDLWPDYLVGMGMLKNPLAIRSLFGLERWLLRLAEEVVVVTGSFRERIIAKGVPEARVSVIPNGVDTRSYFSSVEAPPLPELERRQGEFLVGYLGNMGAGQRLATIVDVAAALARRGSNVRFVLAGDGPDRQSVSDRVRELGLANIVVLPPIAKEATRAFYNACDACLVPLAPFGILQETIPSKIFEVMACERPVIACLDGEGARIVGESMGGVVARPGDVEGIVAAIERVQAVGVGERARMGESGRAYVSRHYDRDVLADDYLAILRSAVARKEGSARGLKGA